MVRFLHAADLHLGLRITRFDESACDRIGEARFEAIEQLRPGGTEFSLEPGDHLEETACLRGVEDIFHGIKLLQVLDVIKSEYGLDEFSESRWQTLAGMLQTPFVRSDRTTIDAPTAGSLIPDPAEVHRLKTR